MPTESPPPTQCGGCPPLAQPAGDGPEWDIELPRLRLRFRLSRPAAAGPATLRSVDFPELSLAGDEDVASLGGLLDGVPHGLGRGAGTGRAQRCRNARVFRVTSHVFPG